MVALHAIAVFQTRPFHLLNTIIDHYAINQNPLNSICHRDKYVVAKEFLHWEFVIMPAIVPLDFALIFQQRLHDSQFDARKKNSRHFLIIDALNTAINLDADLLGHKYDFALYIFQMKLIHYAKAFPCLVSFETHNDILYFLSSIKWLQPYKHYELQIEDKWHLVLIIIIAHRLNN